MEIINNLLSQMVKRNATSMHLSAGMPPLLNINNRLLPSSEKRFIPEEIKDIADRLMNEAQSDALSQNKFVNFTHTSDQFGRIRITFYKQKGLLSAIFKPIISHIPTLEELHLPTVLTKLKAMRSGLVIIGGHAGSGKSSTLAAILNEINKTRSCHIMTIEDPIEYFHLPQRSLFSQREIGTDAVSFAQAVHKAARQDADVIMIGEMRDAETIRTALTAAETGVLVFATMHTTDCVQTITRLIGTFPSDNQQQIRVQVAITLKAVLCQQLVMRTDGTSRTPALEIMFETPAIKNLIRENKIHQIYSVIENGSDFGMQTLDQSLQKLYEMNMISDLEVVSKAVKPEQLKKKLFDSSIPLPESETGGFVDVGEEVIPIEKKMIKYRADFSPGMEGYWTSSIAVVFQDSGLALMPPADAMLSRLYVSDFNVVGKRIPAFELTYRMLLRFKLETKSNQPVEENPQLLIKLFTQPEKDKITAYHKVNLSFPLEINENWHTWVITVPRDDVGKLLKITMFEFPVFLTKVIISDIIMF
ncbi:MAG: PilT/PilU family type 4a pilus ATPase [Candidatus Omnitrophica bacterium]|nr:PilT/PilU family type 4a pilus ATPase [Candidatus Omnitrophota bacterium]MBU4478807.1 PilT/PilU family type 4a pilus ATPase [Candidatus Omnitrophota bacterium]MCG2702878.1 PilT/PilU family type 4a pilus ATPase [Candidatus Omnitrophota bacterium]